MKLSKIAFYAAVTATVAFAACKGTTSLVFEAPGIQIHGEWERNDEEDPEEEGDEYKYTVGGAKLAAIRGEEYKAVFLDKNGVKVGETTGTVPETGDLVITGPENAVDLDWATGKDIESLDMPLPTFVYRAQQQKVFQVVGTTLQTGGSQTIQYALTLVASDLDSAIDRARQIAVTAPMIDKPQDVLCHYLIKAVQSGAVLDVLSMTENPQTFLWLDVNRSWQNETSVDLSQNRWHVLGATVPVSVFSVPLFPGEEVSNTVRIVSGPVDATLTSAVSL